MSGEAYAGWGNDDEYAWEYAAKELNLTIIGDYIPPTQTPIQDEANSTPS
jgi:hypothetical protein